MANPFKEARQHLWDGYNGVGKQERYICHAIQRAADRKAVSQEEASTAVDMIHRRLGEYVSVESWLCCEAHVRLGEMGADRVQCYRFRWLDELSSMWIQGQRT